MQFSPLYFVGLNAGLNTFHYPHTHYPPSQVKSQLFQLDKYASLLKVKLFCMYLISYAVWRGIPRQFGRGYQPSGAVFFFLAAAS